MTKKHFMIFVSISVSIFVLGATLMAIFFESANRIVFMLDPQTDYKFQVMLNDRPDWLNGFSVKRHPDADHHWILSLSPMKIGDRYLKTDIAVRGLRDWSRDARSPNIYGESIWFSGAFNEPILMKDNVAESLEKYEAQNPR